MFTASLPPPLELSLTLLDPLIQVRWSNFASSVNSRYIFACGYPDASFRVIETEYGKHTRKRRPCLDDAFDACRESATGDLWARGRGDGAGPQRVQPQLRLLPRHRQPRLHRTALALVGQGLPIASLYPGSPSPNWLGLQTSLVAGEYGQAGEKAVPRAVLTGHDAEVTCLVVSAEHGLVVSGSADGALLIHTTSGELLRHLDAPAGGAVPRGLLLSRECLLLAVWDKGLLALYTASSARLLHLTDTGLSITVPFLLPSSPHAFPRQRRMGAASDAVAGRGVRGGGDGGGHRPHPPPRHPRPALRLPPSRRPHSQLRHRTEPPVPTQILTCPSLTSLLTLTMLQIHHGRPGERRHRRLQRGLQQVAPRVQGPLPGPPQVNTSFAPKPSTHPSVPSFVKFVYDFSDLSRL